MITLRRLDLVRQDSQATAEELASLQTQLNSIFDRIETALARARVVHDESVLLTVGAAGTAAALPIKPSGYVEIELNGQRFQLPFYAKA